MKRTTILRELLGRPGTVLAPGVHDAIGACIVEKAGFDACYITGNGLVASTLGVPDIGLMTQTEVVSRAASIASSINIPVICDADTGYGSANNVARTVRLFEQAGVAGIHIEDQVNPKRCGAMSGLKLVPVEEACNRIRAAVEARRDDDFVIIARTDARAAMTLEEAIQRVNAYADAGADLVFVEMLESREEIKTVASSVPRPLLYDMLGVSRDMILSAPELESLGVKVVIYPLSSTLLYAKATLELMQSLKATGTIESHFEELMDLHEYEELMGLSRHREFASRFDK